MSCAGVIWGEEIKGDTNIVRYLIIYVITYIIKHCRRNSRTCIISYTKYLTTITNGPPTIQGICSILVTHNWAMADKLNNISELTTNPIRLLDYPAGAWWATTRSLADHPQSIQPPIHYPAPSGKVVRCPLLQYLFFLELAVTPCQSLECFLGFVILKVEPMSMWSRRWHRL